MAYIGRLLSRRRSPRLHLHEFYIEYDSRIGGNDDLPIGVFHVLVTVSERRRDGEEAFTAFFHAIDPYLEACNKTLSAEREDQGLIVVCGGSVENRTALKLAHIEHGNCVARLGRRARAQCDFLR